MQITCSAATNWIVLTIARDCPGVKLSLTVSRKCALSIWISTNTYSILIPAVESMGTTERQKQKNDRWIIHYVLSDMPAVYTLFMVPQTSTHSTCSVLQPCGTHSTCSSHSSDTSESHWVWIFRQELIQRLQLCSAGEGHMWSLLMLLISQAIYSTAGRRGR